MAVRINDVLILELKKLSVPQGKQYIVYYDDKDIGFIVRKSIAGVITYAIEFKDNGDNRKTLKIGNGKMKPAVARCVANSLLKQKLKDRRLKKLNPEDLVEVVINDEYVGVIERDIADIASSFFDNNTNKKIIKNDVLTMPENAEVVIENSSGDICEIIESNATNSAEDYSINSQVKEDIFKEQLDPVSEALFLTENIGSANDSDFRSDMFNKIKHFDIKVIAHKYKELFLENKNTFPVHQEGRAVTIANKYLLSLTKEKKLDESTGSVIIDISDKIKEKEAIIRDRM